MRLIKINKQIDFLYEKGIKPLYGFALYDETNELKSAFIARSCFPNGR